MKPKATYECCNCGSIWEGNPGPQEKCSKCGSIYMKWTNYSEFEIKVE